MDNVKIGRINELARKSKTTGLTEAEKAEQASLRAEYIEAFKANLRATLDSIEIVDELPAASSSDQE